MQIFFRLKGLSSPYVLSIVVLFCCLSYNATADSKTPDASLTVAERSEYQETSTSDEVKDLMDQLAAMSDHVRVYEIGQTVEGRPIQAAEVASRWDEPSDDDDRLTVLLLGNIHSGECAGKEALLMLLRELTLNAKHRWLDDFKIVFVPNYSADANDRMGASHRPGQIGPKKMGLRENVQGLDLNRDFIKLEAPETRALVKLIGDRNPHLFIDTHTTNGSRHRYALPTMWLTTQPPRVRPSTSFVTRCCRK